MSTTVIRRISQPSSVIDERFNHDPFQRLGMDCVPTASTTCLVVGSNDVRVSGVELISVVRQRQVVSSDRDVCPLHSNAAMIILVFLLLL